MPCIYCLKSTEGRPPRAHVFPESIFGDHDDLVLTNGEVCGACNNWFAKRESQFKDRLGLIPLMVGPGVNKRRRPTTINAPGMSGIRDPRDPRISINLGKRGWTASDGRHVRPALKKGEQIEFTHVGQRPDGYHQFRLRQDMRLDEVFVRILTKIAFETICVHRGADYCADLRWHRIRAFILRSEGRRTYAMRKETQMPTRPDGTVRVPVGISLVPLEIRMGGPWTEEWIAIIGIGATFLLDMSPENLLLPSLLDGPLQQAREFVVINTCEGSPQRVA